MNPILNQKRFWLSIGVSLGMLVSFSALAQTAPTITTQPVSLSHSLGDTATFSVSVTGDAPYSFQWLREGVAAVNATNQTLTLTNLLAGAAGDYRVLVSNAVGVATSEVANLDVETTFTRILTGPGATQNAESASWVDYDGDGRLDLVVVGIGGGVFHNNGTNGLVKVSSPLTGPITQGEAPSSDATGAVWGDYDNDGLPDVFIPQGWNDSQNRNVLFHNDGGGRFTRVTKGPIATDTSVAYGGSWGDYDGDGWLDLFVPNTNAGSDPSGPKVKSFLYHNERDGTFSRITNGVLPEFEGFANAATWGDYNNDHRLDLFVSSSGRLSTLYENQGGGQFNAIPQNFAGTQVGASFGDFDNDGRFDLIVVNAFTSALLFRNETGNLDWIGSPASDNRRSMGCAWGDYDNDGWLDLFVPHTSFYDQAGADNNDVLYHNNGDGTFTPLARGSFSFDAQNNDSAAWGDFNDDGFLDLFVCAIDGQSGFFVNNGNTNHWLAFNLKATASNRSAIGAKVRVKATIAGRSLDQLRQVSGGEGWCSQGDPRPHFGLGDATVAESIRIEWPSGQVQEVTNVAANQFLTITEPGGPPTLKASIVASTFRLSISGDPNTTYDLQSTPDLTHWQSVTNVTTQVNGAIDYDTSADQPRRFYRAVKR